MLHNPAYAGTYVFGRRRSHHNVEPDGTIRSRTTMLPREDWGVVIHDHHPGYITWEQFLANEQRLAANRTHDRARPPREGSALLQGSCGCSRCGPSTPLTPSPAMTAATEAPTAPTAPAPPAAAA